MSINELFIPVSIAEAVDKISILKLKCQNCEAEKSKLAQLELDSLNAVWQQSGLIPPESLQDWPALLEVNSSLWLLEERIREHEAKQSFGPDFVQLARSIYQLNDQRSELKRSINQRLGSRLQEVKSYSTLS